MLKRLNEIPTAVETAPSEVTSVAASIDEQGAHTATEGKIESDSESESTEEIDLDELGKGESIGAWFDGDTKSFLISLAVHVALILALASVPMIAAPETFALLIQSLPVSEMAKGMTP